MNLGVLFSGGKDSNFSIYCMVKEGHNIKCLISLISKNKESYMFQSVGLTKIDYSATALGLPLIKRETDGIKEEELNDLEEAIKEAIERYNIEGIVTGAIKSSYQATRIQKICNSLNIKCFNPLWKINEKEYIKKLIENDFKVMIVAVGAYPLNERYLGKVFNESLLNEFKKYEKKYGMNIAGEGGEIETFVLDSPLFKKIINIKNYDIIKTGENSAYMDNIKIELLEKVINK